ncbi:hypothetical protein L9F63_014286, partial [Diploptera punctata]
VFFQWPKQMLIPTLMLVRCRLWVASSNCAWSLLKISEGLVLKRVCVPLARSWRTDASGRSSDPLPEPPDTNSGLYLIHPPGAAVMYTNEEYAYHSVSQAINMAPRRSGSFPGEAANILSPRSSETGGLGVKMVEYVLGSSPTGKDLEPRMRGLVLNPNDSDKVDKDKAPSPFEASKKDVENGNATQSNGIVQNGLVDDDKGFNRTPGSRQPSPAEEDINKNNSSGSNVVVMKVPSSEGVENHHHHPHHHPHMNHHSIPHPQHHMQQQHHLNLDSVNQHFEHVMAMDPNGRGAGVPGGPGMLPPQQQQQAGAGVGGGMDSPGILPPNFDVQLHMHGQKNTELKVRQKSKKVLVILHLKSLINKFARK